MMSPFGRKALWFAIGALVLWLVVAAGVVVVGVFLVSAVPRVAPPATAEHLTVRSYPVAPEIADEMSSAIGAAIASQGRVSLTPNGRLLVAAPQSVQRDVQAMLQDVAARKPAPTPLINFEVWLVSAAPAAAAKAQNEPSLAEIAPALGDIQKTHQGPQVLQFNLLEKLSVQVRSGGNQSHIGGPRAQLQVNDATVRQDSKGRPVIAARIELNQQGGGLKAEVELPAGQLLVLGQSSLPGTPASSQAAASQQYYLVRASL